jgi:hypothetical protein
VLVVQQFCVVAGLPIFNQRGYNPATPWKLNSLGAEPSHAARIISIVMYIYVLQTFNQGQSFLDYFKRNRKEWIAFLWSLFTMGSSTAFVFLMLIVVKFISIKRLLNPLFVSSFVVIVAVLMEVNDAFVRTWEFLKNLYTFDEDLILMGDSSAAFRILPTMRGFKFVGLSSVNDWFGYGIDADQKLISPILSLENGSAGAFSVWVNYGFITSLFFWIVTFKFCHIKGEFATVLIWILCSVIYGGLNGQIVWLPIFLVYTHKLLKKKELYIRNSKKLNNVR